MIAAHQVDRGSLSKFGQKYVPRRVEVARQDQRVANVREVFGVVAGVEGLWREVTNGPNWILSLNEVGLRVGVVEVLVQMVFGILHRSDGCFVLLQPQVLKGVTFHRFT
jgi:hypothetical protein